MKNEEVGVVPDNCFRNFEIFNKLVQNLTQSFSDIGRDRVLTTVLHYSFKSTPTTVLVLKH
jgi:hypothetical protein